MIAHREQLIDSLIACRDWFDVAARSFLYVRQKAVQEASLPEATFISAFIDEGTSSTACNPNLPILHNLAYEVSCLVERQQGGSIRFDDALRDLIDMVRSISLEPFRNGAANEAAIAWFLVLSIDSTYSRSCFAREHSSSQPLNSWADADGIGVYFFCRDARIEDALVSHGLERIPKGDFGSQLECLLFYDREDNVPLPVIRTLPQSMRRLHVTDDSQEFPRLRIGVCPFTSQSLCGSTPDAPIELKHTVGSSLTVEYHESIDELFDFVVLPALLEAMRSGCQILVFPELVFAPSFHGRLADALRDRGGASSLMLVLAGSTWDGERGQNCTYLYDGKGNLLGKYHKHEPYVTFEDSTEMLEALLFPDEPDTLIDIPGLGRIMPAICKDVVINGSTAQNLVKALYPQLVCIPAMSGSIKRGFESQLKLLAERRLTISCMANLCVMRQKHNAGELGYVCVPAYKKDEPWRKQPEPYIESLPGGRSCSGCDGGAAESTFSCLDVIDIDYGDEKKGLCPSVCVKKHKLN